MYVMGVFWLTFTEISKWIIPFATHSHIIGFCWDLNIIFHETNVKRIDHGLQEGCTACDDTEICVNDCH